jgi:hypothetical protein
MSSRAWGQYSLIGRGARGLGCVRLNEAMPIADRALLPAML